jgi:hypothetical protein
LYDYYAETTAALQEKHPELRRSYSNSVFAACTFNLGPRTVCFPHRDFANLSFGWCAITAIGDFDYTKGGHLILWDLKIVLEFPPGSTILIPSACLLHSNVEIAPGEQRMSMTQYSAGGLFRWASYGFMKESGLQKDKAGWAAELESRLTRWEWGLGLYSTKDSLRLNK